MDGMEEHEGSGVRGSVIQSLIALAIILAAFRVADVAPLRVEAPVAAEPAYVLHVRAVDEALARRDTVAAAREWQTAYAAALATPGWEGLVAAGDAARRARHLNGSSGPADAKARTAYLIAFFRARHQASVAGMARAADAFAALGDHEVAERLGRETASYVASEQVKNADRTVASRPAVR
jgi:hypothetical protein